MLLTDTEASGLRDLFSNPALNAADRAAWAGTLDTLEERHARHPDDVAARIALGLACAVLTDYDRAMALLAPPIDLAEAVTTYLPSRQAVWLGLAGTLPGIGRTHDAVALLDALRPKIGSLPSYLRDEHRRLDALLRGNALTRLLRGRTRGKRGPGKEYRPISAGAALGLIGTVVAAVALGFYLLGPDQFRSRGAADLYRGRLAVMHLQNSGQTIESMRKVDGDDDALVPREYFERAIENLEWARWLRPDDLASVVLEIRAYEGLVSLRPPQAERERCEAAVKTLGARLDELDPKKTERRYEETLYRVHVSDLEKGEVRRL